MADNNNDTATTDEQENKESAMDVNTNSDEQVKDGDECKDTEDVKDDDEDKDEGDMKEEEEEEEEEELPPGLLEQPLEVKGKREKKKVERLSAAMLTHSTEKKKVEIEDGCGKKLVEIPFIENKLNVTLASDLKPLHRLLFLRLGAVTEVKRNIRQFCGFTHSKESKEHERRVSMLNKMHLPELKSLCLILGLEKGGTKKDVMERIVDFLMAPSDKGLKVTSKKVKRRSKSTDGKKEKKKGVKRKRKTEKTAKKKPKVSVSEDDDAGSLDDEDNEEEIEASEEEESEEEAPKKKKKKTEPKKKSSGKVNGKKEKAPTKKAPKKTTPKKKKVPVEELSDELSDDSDSDEPIAKLVKSPPTNDDIKALVKKILDGADLESVTMKTVVKEVYSKYPTFDLSDRKDFIKSAVREVIS